MIGREEVWRVVEKYKNTAPSLAVLGSHSALEIGYGARKAGLKSVVVCEKGREKTYTKYYKNLFDEFIVLDKFKDMAKNEVQEKLLKLNAIFVPNRSFSVYVGYGAIENELLVPIFGSRKMLRIEERGEEKGEKDQYYLLKKAGIKTPRRFKSGREIDRLAIAKVMKKDSVERAFFFASSPKDFERKLDERVKRGVISREAAENVVIEEYIVGAKFNANFFYSPLNGELELLGFDRRIQTDIDGILDLPAQLQLEIMDREEAQKIEIGHYGATMRESQIEKIFEAGERFVKASKKEFAPGIIGLFALQGAVDKELDFYVFDVSPRIPGAPCVEPTSPYIKYKHYREVGQGERVAMEIKEAKRAKRLREVVT